jgi:OmpA-OmpF porin, OOP family
MYKRVALNGLVALSLLGGAAVHADSQPGFYAGASVGKAKVEDDGFGFDADDTAFKVFGGYSFNQYFGVEASYFDGGKADDRVGLFGTTAKVEADITGFNLSAVGRLPLGEAFSLFAKVGYASYDLDVTASAGTIRDTVDAGDEDLSYGVGAAFNLGESFELRAEYEAVDVSGGDFNVISIGAAYKF